MQLYWVRENELTGEKKEFIIDYSYEGRYYPATLETPEEYPDLVFTIDEMEMEQLTESEHQSIENACANRDGFLLTLY